MEGLKCITHMENYTNRNSLFVANYIDLSALIFSELLCNGLWSNDWGLLHEAVCYWWYPCKAGQ